MPDSPRVPAYFLLVLAYVLGCVSLGLFGLFLWLGPSPMTYMNLTAPQILCFDALLAIAFFLQHSGMIRKSFRARLAMLLPARCQPALYAIVSGVMLMLLPLLWQPTHLGLLTLRGPLRWLVRAAFLAAMAGMVWGFGSLRHFDPLGAGPLLVPLQAKPAPEMPLIIRGDYRWVRHPIYASFLLMVGPRQM